MKSLQKGQKTNQGLKDKGLDSKGQQCYLPQLHQRGS